MVREYLGKIKDENFSENKNEATNFDNIEHMVIDGSGSTFIDGY